MDSRYFSSADIVGVLVLLAVVALVSLAVSAWLLRLVVAWVAKSTPGYWRCVLVAFLAALFGGGGSVVLLAAFPGAFPVDGRGVGNVGMLLALVATNLLPLAIEAGAIWSLLRAPDGAPMSFGRAVLAAVLHLVLCMLLYGAVMVAFIATVGGVPGVSR